MKQVILDKYVQAFKGGIQTEDIPIVLADIYQDVMKVRGLSRTQITRECVDTLNYIVDNTDAGKHDDIIDEACKALIPSIVLAFMNITHRRMSFKQCCGCC